MRNVPWLFSKLLTEATFAESTGFYAPMAMAFITRFRGMDAEPEADDYGLLLRLCRAPWTKLPMHRRVPKV